MTIGSIIMEKPASWYKRIIKSWAKQNKIFWNDEKARFCLGDLTLGSLEWHKSFEVLGNIYENQELLK